jgi:mannosyltransferase
VRAAPLATAEPEDLEAATPAPLRPGRDHPNGHALAAPPAGIALAGIIVLAAVLRLALLGQRSVWLDEAFAVWIAQHPWGEIPRLLRTLDQHPPAYYLLMHAWQGIAGTSEAAVRFPSACFGVASVLLTYMLVRRVAGEDVGVLSAFVVALSPFQIMAAQEARMYPLLGVLCLASTLALLSGVERGGTHRWGIYAAASTLAAYTHYLGLLVLAAHGMWVAGWERRHLGRWLACAAAVAVAFAPWIPSLAQQMREIHSFDWYHNRALYMSLNDLLGLASFGGSRFGAATYLFLGRLQGTDQFVLLLPFLLVLWRGAVASPPRALALLGLPIAITIGGMLMVSWTVRPMFVPRWFSFLVPMFAAFLAAGIYDLAAHLAFPKGRVVALLVGVLLLYELPVLDRYYLDPADRPFQWRAAAEVVRELARPGDALVFVGKSASIPFTYYFHDPYPAVDASAAGPSPFAGFAPAQLAAVHPRIWVVAAIPFPESARDRVLEGFRPAYRVVSFRNFAGAIVYLLSAGP